MNEKSVFMRLMRKNNKKRKTRPSPWRKCAVHCQVFHTGSQFVFVIHAAAFGFQSPAARRRARRSTNTSSSRAGVRSFDRVDVVSFIFTPLRALVRGLGGRPLCFVASVFLLHEQRTGWSSRLGTARRWRAGGLFTIITRSR